MTISRFAPSPTGRLHLGHAYSALKAHDFARERGGDFLLRIEDIDPGRSRDEHVSAILDDLRWLGLRWDGEVMRQSDHMTEYAAALDQLRALGLLYPCFCTRTDIAASTTAPHGPDGPIYPGTCRSLPGAAQDMTRPHAWRIDIARAAAMAGPLVWREGETEVAATPEIHGDVVLARKDTPASYHLAVTVDDAAQRVTDVVRGEDLRDATHVHRLLQALLGLPSPVYHHHGLLTDAEGRRLAKRQGAPALADLRAQGVDPATLVAALRKGVAPLGFALASA